MLSISSKVLRSLNIPDMARCLLSATARDTPVHEAHVVVMRLALTFRRLMYQYILGIPPHTKNACNSSGGSSSLSRLQGALEKSAAVMQVLYSAHDR